MKSAEKNLFLKGNVGVFPIPIPNPQKKAQRKEDEGVLLCSLIFSACLPPPSQGNYLSKLSKLKGSSA